MFISELRATVQYSTVQCSHALCVYIFTARRLHHPSQSGRAGAMERKMNRAKGFTLAIGTVSTVTSGDTASPVEIGVWLFQTQDNADGAIAS